jgi:murein L,D-transpeptidase YcbB/YkuD
MADGVFAIDTEEALRRFQASAGLAADGIAGPQTIAALQEHRPKSLPGLVAAFFTSLPQLLRRLMDKRRVSL